MVMGMAGCTYAGLENKVDGDFLKHSKANRTLKWVRIKSKCLTLLGESKLQITKMCNGSSMDRQA